MALKTVGTLYLGAVALAALMCATPVSLQRLQGDGGLSLKLSDATAAELGAPARRAVVRRSSYLAVSRAYDRYCDGPYVGGGWNGGTYYGGPFVDLRCYGQLPWGPPPTLTYWWGWGW